ncbi:unnamed protein product [Dibothriocephalus latus]|uniref:Uncharacterized protein n=1 Tax=Dibothriocephalus latus TaxID=60516 RepID=A0A3P7QFF4_DIBLA|nr:unnamed protein product [Dibothriocephalus latus]
MFLERLPSSIQTVLATGSDDCDVAKLATMADKMTEVERSSSVSMAHVSQPVAVLGSDLSDLKAQVAQMVATIATMLYSHPHYSLSPGCQRNGGTLPPDLEILPPRRIRSGELDRSSSPGPVGHTC